MCVYDISVVFREGESGIKNNTQVFGVRGGRDFVV